MQGPVAHAGVRDTSMAAYRALQYSGKMSRQQKQVLDFCLAHPGRNFTRQELARELGLGINVICGRVNELLREPFNLLEEKAAAKRRCSITGKDVNALSLTEESA